MEGLREFFEVNGYVVELMICNFLFCLSQKRRRRYGVNPKFCVNSK